MPGINDGFNAKFFNPLEKFDALEKSKGLTKQKKAAIWLSSIIVGSFTLGVGGVALFRYLVGKNIKPLEPNKTTKKVDTLRDLFINFKGKGKRETDLPQLPEKQASERDILKNYFSSQISISEKKDDKSNELEDDSPAQIPQTVLNQIDSEFLDEKGGYKDPTYADSQKIESDVLLRFNHVINAFDEKVGTKNEYRAIFDALEKSVDDLTRRSKNVKISSLREKYINELSNNADLDPPFKIIGKAIFDEAFSKEPPKNFVNEFHFDQTFSLYYDGELFSPEEKDFIYKAFNEALEEAKVKSNASSYKEVDPSELYVAYADKIDQSPLFKESEDKTSEQGNRAVQVLAIAMERSGRGAGVRFEKNLDDILEEILKTHNNNPRYDFRSSRETKQAKNAFFNARNELKTKYGKVELIPVSELYEKFSQKLDEARIGRKNPKPLSRETKANAKRAFANNYSFAFKKDAVKEPLSETDVTGEAAPPMKSHEHEFKSIQNTETKRKEIYKSATAVNPAYQIKYHKGIGGAGSVAFDVAQHYNHNEKIGVMIAANSGLPAGGLNKHMGRVAYKDLNYKTQEESVVANWMLTECGTNAQNQETLFATTIKGKWGMQDGTSHKTLQKIDFTKAKDPKFYNRAYIVNNCNLSNLKRGANGKWLDTKNTAKVSLVFADSVNANASVGTKTGTMQRTLNEKAIIDYDFFKECIKEKLRASLDGMVEQGITIALVAPLSTGVYAGKHKDAIGKDFHGLLKEVLDEVQEGGQPRGAYFKEVIIPQLG